MPGSRTALCNTPPIRIDPQRFIYCNEAMQTNTPDFSHAVLGESRGKISFDGSDALRLAALRMAEQAQHTLKITSRDLDPSLYDNEPFLEAIKNLTLRSRRARLYVLVNNTERAIKNGHRLIELYQRLSTFIEIRVQATRFHDYNQAVLIADETGYIRRRMSDRYEAEADFDAPRIAREMNKEFDEMWAESVTDPNLRRLHI